MTDLRRYAWHTGATPRPLERDAPTPVLFRDVGLDATATFLRRGLRRLAGPMTPLLYARTHRWPEPYVDHARLGRLVLLDPRGLGFWHAGVPDVFVAPAGARAAPGTVAWVPGDRGLGGLTALLRGVRTADEVHEALGGAAHRALAVDTAARLEALMARRDAQEARLAPVRRALQAGDAWARAWLADHGLTEHDLCAAWHHLAPDRVARLDEALAAWAAP